MDNRNAYATDVLGDVYNLPFKSKSIELVIADQLLEHMHNPYLTLLEIWRVLKDDGQLSASVPVPGTESSFDPTHVSIFGRDRWLSILSGFFNKIEWMGYGIRFKHLPKDVVKMQEELIRKGHSDLAEGLHFVCTKKNPDGEIQFRSVPWWLEEELSKMGELTFYEDNGYD